MKSIWKSIISLLLVVVFLFQLFPVASFAVDPEETPQESPVEEAVEEAAKQAAEEAETASQDSYIVGETGDRREESVKHYRLNDGSFYAVDYGYPIHYKDAEDNWVDIDNTLVQSGDKLVSVNGDMTKSFPDSLATGELFEVGYKDYRISMSLVAPESDSVPSEEASMPVETNLPEETEAPEQEAAAEESAAHETQEPEASAEPAATESPSSSFDRNAQAITAYSRVQNAAVKAVVENPSAAEKIAGQSSTEEMITLDKIRSSIRFDNAIKNTDLLYENKGYDLKESIIIRERQPEYVYSFALELTGLTPFLQETGSILLNNSQNEPVFEIPAPYMFDANGTVSNQAKYALVQSNDSYILTVSADAAWINAEDRAFPVTVDPTILVHNDGTIKTTYIRENYGTYTGSAVEMYCGYNTAYGDCQILVQFTNMPSIPANCVPTGAQLSLLQAAYYTSSNTGGSAPSGNIVVEAHEINGTISNVANYTWNTFYPGGSTDKLGTSVLDHKEIGASTINHYITWDISTAAIPWLYSGAINVGVALTAPGAQEALRNSNFYGSSTSDYSPYLCVEYRNGVGLEDYYTYQEASAGRAGYVYISDFTQKMTLVNTDVSLSLAPMDFSIEHIYNSCQANHFFTSYLPTNSIDMHTKNYDSMKLGLGWKLSLQQTIVEKTIGGTQYLIYTDEDGTEHYFLKDGSKYKDEDGLGLTITESTSNSPKIYTMTDTDEFHTWTFHNGYLLKISDCNGNYITIAYNNTFESGLDWHPVSGQPNRIKQVKQHTNSESQSNIIVATFAYDGDYLSSITDYANRTISFSYKNSNNVNTSRLLTITHPDNTVANYVYRDAGEMTRAYDGESKNGLEFSYWGANDTGTGYTHTVRNLKEYYAADNTSTRSYGNQMHFYHNSSHLTSMRFYGANHKEDTANDTVKDDKVVFNTFDYYGRTITTYTTDWSKSKLIGVTAGSYKPNNGISTSNNHLEKKSSSGQHLDNMVLDSGLEYLDFNNPDTNIAGWAKSRSTTNSSNADVSVVGSCSNAGASVSPHTGAKMLSTFLGGSTTIGNGYSFLKQGIDLKAGETYILSAYVNTATVSQFDPDDETHGAFIAFMSGSTFRAKSEIIRYNTNKDVSGGWERISVSYTPQNNDTYYIMIGQKGILGYTEFDDIQLEHSDSITQVNLIQDAGFERIGATQQISYWSYPRSRVSHTEILDEYTMVEDMPIQGGGHYAAHLTGAANARKAVPQEISIKLPWDTSFLLSGWGKAESVPYDIKDSYSTYDSFFGLIAILYYSDGSHSNYYVPFCPTYERWQYTAGILYPKEDKAAGVTIDRIKVYYAYYHNQNDAFFDNISLIQTPTQLNNIDDDGYLLSSTSGESKTSYEYCPDSHLIQKITSPSGTTHSFIYQDITNNLISETNANLSNTYTYNSSGEVTKKTTQKQNSAIFYEATNDYGSTQNHLLTSYDINGIRTHFTYGSSHLLLSSRIGDENVDHPTQYYDPYVSNGRMYQTYLSGLTSITYGYSNGLVKYLTRKSYDEVGSTNNPNWQRYILAHDNFGNSTYVGVTGKNNASSDYPQSKKLVTYEYESSVNNGRLQQKKYPNGNTVDYSYDLFDRLTTESYTNNSSTNPENKQHKYYYDAEGRIAREESVNSNGAVTESYIYDYDTLGRLIHSKELGPGKSMILRTERQYDTSNRLSKYNWYLKDGATYTQGFTYSTGASGDETLTSITSKFSLAGYSWEPSITFKYTDLQQIRKKTTGHLFYRAFSYKTDSSTQQTGSQVEYMNYRRWVSDSNQTGQLIKGYKFNYDDLGNITEVYKSSESGTLTQLQNYTYDKLGQLTGCVDHQDPNTTRTYCYAYDTAGNITSMTGGTGGTKTLKYEDSMWHDRLTSVKIGSGQEVDIIYETPSSGFISGNPISYYNGQQYSFSWKNGRQLATASVGSTSVTYDYDMAGVRSKKTVGSTEYSYDTINGLVTHQKWGNRDLYFVYDDNNQPYALFYKNSSGTVSRYYYLLNLQGDVVALMNGSYSLVAEYRYDPWGAVKVYDANGTEITDTDRIGVMNPLRYRGYYYDTETKLYYLQSRYYDPAIGRFINGDSYVTTGETDFLGYNMFAYCENDPVNNYDTKGSRSVAVNVMMADSGYHNDPIDKDDGIVLYSEHHKKGTTNPSNKDKHDKGEERRKRDQGREKGDSRRPQNRSNKRRIDSPSATNAIVNGVIIVGTSIAVAIIVADDATFVGAVDDTLIIPLMEVIRRAANCAYA